MSRRKGSAHLVGAIDKFAEELLKRAVKGKLAAPEGDLSGDKGDPPAVEATIAEQVSVFAAVTRWVQIKHKIDPDDDEPTDFIARARKQLNGGTSRHRGRSPPAKDSPIGSDTGAED